MDDVDSILREMKSADRGVRPGKDCPSEEVLGSYLEGSLHGMEKTRIDEHIAGCDYCAVTLGICARTRARFEGEIPPALGDDEAAVETMLRPPWPRLFERLAQLFPIGRSASPFGAWGLAAGVACALLVVFVHLVDQETGTVRTPSQVDLVMFASVPSLLKGPESEPAAFSETKLRGGEHLTIDFPLAEGQEEVPGYAFFLAESGDLIDWLEIGPARGRISWTTGSASRPEPFVRIEVGEGVGLVQVPATELLADRYGGITAVALWTEGSLTSSAIRKVATRMRTALGSGARNKAPERIAEAFASWEDGGVRHYGVGTILFQEGERDAG